MNKDELAKMLEQAMNGELDERTREKIKKALKLAKQKTADAKEAMSLTCFGSLVFCCATPTDKSSGLSSGGKNCFWRDAAITLSGMSPEDINKLKAKWNKELLDRK